jgi:large subunit ribosomal protein L3
MNTNPGIFGKKVGMTQYFRPDGSVARCTVINTASVVVGKRTVERDGYTALVLGFGDAKEKHLTKSVITAFKKVNAPLKKEVREMRCTPEFAAQFEIGATLPLDQVFQVGQHVDAQGTTRGRGFTGVVRRWGFAGFVQTHGTHEYRRHGGSIGTNMTPGRTLPNMKMPGHYGDETVSILNLKVARIIAEQNLLLVEGGIPGARNSFVTVRGAVKKKNGGKKA